ncbi:S-layer glycoprotein N-glycosyltransferase AglJ [Halonotius terrestris]|uniref:S-layer glycoprotein N-glycosyltransferase AglJ n=1 Tax=Halonotius terrestris TaxID=2487750 RepID=A0A8J8TBD3_9EURY|nr:S-layer glycoprotein N-glycosyltransferase AglJ [Halonotius terrestris]TQQ78370.1 S-layer glycoprotein N-glycosyltransferase AglJ [Halonotius terrestris]
MAPSADVCVLLPAFNESATITDVITSYQAAGFTDILVIDGGSTDGTRELAREAGATVITQTGTGKGQAVREAVRKIDARYVLMADADMTYLADDAETMLEPLLAGEAEHVIGNRFADMKPGAMTTFNKIGNQIFNRFFSVVYGYDYGDILSGYRAFTTESFERLTLSADGFGIETEMAVQCAKQNIETTVVPITYRPRPDGSATNLHPIKDGSVIFMELYRNAKTSNPLFYFGSVGLLSTTLGVGLLGFVIYRWLAFNIDHELIALGGVASILLGVQLLIFGFLADMIQSLHREQRERIDRLETDLTAEQSKTERRRTNTDGAAIAENETADAEGNAEQPATGESDR